MLGLLGQHARRYVGRSRLRGVPPDRFRDFRIRCPSEGVAGLEERFGVLPDVLGHLDCEVGDTLLINVGNWFGLLIAGRSDDGVRSGHAVLAGDCHEDVRNRSEDGKLLRIDALAPDALQSGLGDIIGFEA